MIIRKVKVTEYEYQAPINYVAGATEPDIQFQLTDYEIPSGATGRVYVGRSDGTFEYTVATISGNTVTVAPTSSMFSVKGPGAIQVTLYVGNEVVKNFAVPVYVHADLADDSAKAGSDVTGVFRAAEEEALADFQEQAEEIAEEVKESIPEDYTELTEEVSELNERIDNLDPGLSDAAKEALLACFEHVAWIDGYGQIYYNALRRAIYPDAYPKITAVYNPGSHIVWDTDSLDSLKTYLTVTYFETEEATGQVLTSSQYTLLGNLTAGESVITVIYDTLTTSFVATVATHFLYKLQEPAVFTGNISEAIDTGVALFATDRSYTIVAKADVINYIPSNTGPLSLYGNASHNMRTYLPSGGGTSMAYQVNVANNKNKAYVINGSWTGKTYNNTFVLVLAHTANSNAVTIKFYVDGIEATQGPYDGSYSYTQIDYNFFIGARAATNGNPCEPFVGTISVFELYDYAMSQAEINSTISRLLQ